MPLDPSAGPIDRGVPDDNGAVQAENRVFPDADPGPPADNPILHGEDQVFADRNPGPAADNQALQADELVFLDGDHGPPLNEPAVQDEDSVFLDATPGPQDQVFPDQNPRPAVDDRALRAGTLVFLEENRGPPANSIQVTHFSIETLQSKDFLTPLKCKNTFVKKILG
jgi:hypothetical protein